MKKYCVYCHTNKINGKKYIGITSQKPQYRWKNGQGYRNNEYFFRAIEKYGWHNFTHEILYTDLSKEDAECIEVKLIAEYKTTDNQNGYNIEAGGNATKEVAESTRAKISEALKGHSCTEETKKKISERNSGKPSPRKGIKMSAEQIEKNRLSHMGQTPWNKGKTWSEKDKPKFGGKAVKCVELNEVFGSAHEAGRALEIDFSSICKCVKGKAKTVGGYHWVTAEEVTEQ